MPVTYEWKLELCDEHGDIVDVLHFSENELRDALEAFIRHAPDHHAAEIALVRDWVADGHRFYQVYKKSREVLP